MDLLISGLQSRREAGNVGGSETFCENRAVKRIARFIVMTDLTMLNQEAVLVIIWTLFRDYPRGKEQ